MASRPGSPAAKAATAAPDLDPVYQWVDDDGRYLLHLNLPGFKKEDFRVHVDPAGQLSILGHRTADGGAGNVRLHKVFQLPSTSDLDTITGRYDGNVLTLTVPKLPPAPVLPPEAPKEEVHKESPNDVADKPTDRKSEVSRKAERLIEAARARLQGRRKEETSKDKTAMRSMEETAATNVDERKQEPKAKGMTTPVEKVVNGDDDQDEKAKAAQHEEKLECEAARARLHAAAREMETQREKKGCWKERAVEEGFKWADTIGKNKEVIAATAVAAFTLGAFVSHRLFSKNY